MRAANQGSERGSRYAGSIAWILGAFALLIIGVIAGALAARRSWAWTFPTAGFVGYVLAFRRGLIVWKPDGIDLVWRSAVGRKRGIDPRPPSTKGPGRGKRTARLIRGAFPIAPSSQSPTATHQRS